MDIDGIFFSLGAKLNESFKSVAKDVESAFAGMTDKLNAFSAIGNLGEKLKAGIFDPLLELGVTFDSAFDKIRASTGKTGEEFEKLQQSFRNVFGTVPDDAKKVSEAISELAQRTASVGPGFDNLAKTFLDLSRLTGEAVGPSIEKMTRLFGDWGVEIEKQVPTMDTMLKISQQTGIGFNELAAKVVTVGAPFRQLGFTLEEAALAIGKFEKEGVNAQNVLGGMRTALSKFSAAGMDPAEGFKHLVDSIKNADVATGNLIAKQAVGVRNMADFAAAAREGRFDLEGLAEAISKSGESIDKATKDTQDYAEAWAIMKNRITLALEPLGKMLFDTLNQIMVAMEPVINVVIALAAKFGELSTPIKVTILVVAGIAAAVGPALIAFGAMGAAITSISAAIGIIMGPAFLAGMLLAMKAIAIAAAAAAAAFALWKLGEWLLQFPLVQKAIAAVSDAISALIGWIMKIPGVATAVKAMGDAWDSTKKAISGMADKAKESVTHLAASGAAMLKTGDAAKKGGVDMDMFGKKAEAAAKKAAQEHEAMEKRIEGAWKGVLDLLDDLPRTWDEAMQAMGKGFNFDASVGKLEEKIKDLNLQFGNLKDASEKAIVKGMIVHLTMAANQMREFAAKVAQIKLDRMFDALDKSLNDYWHNFKNFSKDHAEIMDKVAAISMKDATESIKNVNKISDAFKQLGQVWSFDLEAGAYKAEAAFKILFQQWEQGKASLGQLYQGQLKVISAQIELAKSMGQSTVALEGAYKRVSEQIRELALRTMTLDGAFKALGITSTDTYVKMAETAEVALNKIIAAYEREEASVMDVGQAMVKNTEAQIKATQAQGASAAQLILLLDQQKNALAQMTPIIDTVTVQWVAFGHKVTDSLGDFAVDLINVAKGTESLGQAFTKLGRQIIASFEEVMVKGIIKKLLGEFNILNLGIVDTEKKITSLGSSLSSLFGAGDKASVKAGGIGGGGSGGGSMTSGLGGITGIVGMVSQAVSAIANVVNAFSLKVIESDTGKIEVNTRGQLAEALNFRRDSWDQHKGVVTTLGMIFTRLGDMWDTLRSGFGGTMIGMEKAAATTDLSLRKVVDSATAVAIGGARGREQVAAISASVDKIVGAVIETANNQGKQTNALQEIWKGFSTLPERFEKAAAFVNPDKTDQATVEAIRLLIPELIQGVYAGIGTAMEKVSQAVNNNLLLIVRELQGLGKAMSGGGSMGIFDAFADAVNGMGQTIGEGLRQMGSLLQVGFQTEITQLAALNAMIGSLVKAMWPSAILPSTVASGSNPGVTRLPGQSGTQGSTTVNVFATTNDPYRIGTQVAQGMQAALPRNFS